MKLVKACIAMAAFAALFVVPSIASAVNLTAPTGTTIPNGTNIIATNVAHANTKEHTLMTTPVGTITCDRATLTGKLLTNSVTPAVGEITTVQFEGPTPGSACSGPLGSVTVTPSHTVNGTLPWCIRAGALDSLTIYGKPAGGTCHSGVMAPLTFTLHTGGLVCNYEKASLTATYTTHPADAVATVTNQNFIRHNSSVFCPAEGKLDMAFTLTKDNNGSHGEAIYIDS
jgi:hypothetical protein